MLDFVKTGRRQCFFLRSAAAEIAVALREAGLENDTVPVPAEQWIAEGKPPVFLFVRPAGSCRASFLVNDPLLLLQRTESAAWLSAAALERAAAETVRVENAEAGTAEALLAAFSEAYPALLDCIRSGKVRAVNLCHPRLAALLAEGEAQTQPAEELSAQCTGEAQTPCAVAQPGGGAGANAEKREQREQRFSCGPAFLPAGKKRVNILAIGDVGSNLLTGLHLLGGDVISEIGICDLDERVTARWAFEQNQIAYPWDYDRLPEVRAISAEQLFDCDVVVFVASKGIPPVGSGVKDVRMYQFENNRRIVAAYARQAREAGFRGMFCQVSDPVDPLAKVAFLESNRNASGELDWKGLRAEQIQGFGLGVMNARAAYYAKRDPRFSRFLTEGRSFGPHGQELVIADSIAHYDDAISRELTERVVTANLEMRALGFKPFVAPAFSSGALSILLMLRGEWHCGSVYLGGVFMGVRNRYTPRGLETEILPLPAPLFARICEAEQRLKEIV